MLVSLRKAFSYEFGLDSWVALLSVVRESTVSRCAMLTHGERIDPAKRLQIVVLENTLGTLALLAKTAGALSPSL